MAEVTWSPRSLKDINEIAEYISKDSLQYAEEQVKHFFSSAKVLEKHPLFGRMVPELRTFSIRQLLSGHYRLIYEIINRDSIAVITVHHQSRLLKNNPAMKRFIIGKKKK